jgi:hypothetical protein
LFDVKREAEYIICGKEQMKKQATAKEHVEKCLKIKMRLFLSGYRWLEVAARVGATLSFSRFDLAMINIL